jgi:hypothetical protein
MTAAAGYEYLYLVMDATNPLFIVSLGAGPKPILATMALMHESDAKGDQPSGDMESLDHSDFDWKLADAWVEDGTPIPSTVAPRRRLWLFVVALRNASGHGMFWHEHDNRRAAEISARNHHFSARTGEGSPGVLRGRHGFSRKTGP